MTFGDDVAFVYPKVEGDLTIIGAKMLLEALVAEGTTKTCQIDTYRVKSFIEDVSRRGIYPANTVIAIAVEEIPVQLLKRRPGRVISPKESDIVSYDLGISKAAMGRVKRGMSTPWNEAWARLMDDATLPEVDRVFTKPYFSFTSAPDHDVVFWGGLHHERA